jgi:hypothetical protein
MGSFHVFGYHPSPYRGTLPTFDVTLQRPMVLHNFLGPAPLRRAAAMLISVVLVQVCLGIAAFLMLVLNAAGTFAFVLATVGHVSIGAATLAASVVMAMQVWRSVPPKAGLPATRESI